MHRLRNKKPYVTTGPLDSPYHSKTYTLIEYYGETLDNFKDKALGIYDEDLNKIFATIQRSQANHPCQRSHPQEPAIPRGNDFPLDRRPEKVVAPVIGRFFLRCRELKLSLSPDDESYSLASLAALGTTVVMNYLHTGRYIPD